MLKLSTIGIRSRLVVALVTTSNLLLLQGGQRHQGVAEAAETESTPHHPICHKHGALLPLSSDACCQDMGTWMNQMHDISLYIQHQHETNLGYALPIAGSVAKPTTWCDLSRLSYDEYVSCACQQSSKMYFVGNNITLGGCTDNPNDKPILVETDYPCIPKSCVEQQDEEADVLKILLNESFYQKYHNEQHHHHQSCKITQVNGNVPWKPFNEDDVETTNAEDGLVTYQSNNNNKQSSSSSSSSTSSSSSRDGYVHFFIGIVVLVLSIVLLVWLYIRRRVVAIRNNHRKRDDTAAAAFNNHNDNLDVPTTIKATTITSGSSTTPPNRYTDNDNNDNDLYDLDDMCDLRLDNDPTFTTSSRGGEQEASHKQHHEFT